MKFVDEGYLELIAGKGGDGIIAFRREFKVALGGPSGGDGGDGGSIFFVGDKGTNTLLSVTSLHRIKAMHGENGKRNRQHGANGKNTYIKVPIGTLVYDENILIADILKEQPYLIVQGGKGGKGNCRFKSSVNQAPRIAENGTLGKKMKVRLELQLLANVGFVGLPSAGKSTLLSIISNATPKIGDYDFTTIIPQLGLVKIDKTKSLTVADLPGLIKGASYGRGLGHAFLKHISRCRVIAHVIDFGSNRYNPIDSFQIINNELKNYNLQLENRPQLVVANKKDLSFFQKNFDNFVKKYPQIKIVAISALTSENISKLKYSLWDVFQKSSPIITATKQEEITISFQEDVQIKKIGDHLFSVYGKSIENLVQKIPFSTHENLLRFNQRLKTLGVWQELKRKGVQIGDDVQVLKYQFTWGQDD